MIDFTSTKMKLDLNFPKDKLMLCPFCGMGHPMYINGTTRDYHSDELVLHPNEGYSFCNCKNIWYTDWKNINQEKYHYTERLNSLDIAEDNSSIRFRESIDTLSSFNKDIKKFLDIGCGLHFLDDLIHKKLGWEVTGIDMNGDLEKNNRKLIVGDIGDKNIFAGIGKFDVVLASHVIEHLKDPIKFLYDINDNIEDGGLLLIMSPDPSFLNLVHPSTYTNFGIHQHHTIWNVYDYAQEVKNAGYIVGKAMNLGNPLATEWQIFAHKPSNRNKLFIKCMGGKDKGIVPLDSISPEDSGHNLDDIDKEHREGAEAVKKLIGEGKKILPIACTEYGKRLDGFKRYIAYKELGIKEIEVVIEKRGGCQHGEPWVM